jgi:mono/diheme cytochrome c family protein
MADPLDVSYIPKPEWNFLFLYQSLKYFPGRLEAVGTVGIPTVLVLIFVLLPFVDRNPERDPLKRPIAMLCALILAGIIVAISVIGYLSPGFAHAPAKAVGTTSESRFSPVTVLSNALHMRSSEAANPSPEAKASPAPRPTRTDQPPSASPSEHGEPGRSAYVIGSAERGAELFKKNCTPCHGPGGVNNVPNPGSDEGKVPNLKPIDPELFSTDAQTFAENIDRYIQHGAAPAGPHPAIRMPAFGDSNTLTQQEIANLEAYVLNLNGVDRAQVVNPGMRPRSFLLLVVVVYIVIILILGGLWNKRSPRRD